MFEYEKMEASPAQKGGIWNRIGWGQAIELLLAAFRTAGDSRRAWNNYLTAVGTSGQWWCVECVGYGFDNKTATADVRRRKSSNG